MYLSCGCMRIVTGELRQALTAVWQAACQHRWGSLQQCSLLRQGAEVAVGHATALRGHDVAKLRVQDLTTTNKQPIAHRLHELLVAQKFWAPPQAPEAVAEWIEDIASSWDFRRIIPCHFAAPITATPADLRSPPLAPPPPLFLTRSSRPFHRSPCSFPLFYVAVLSLVG